MILETKNGYIIFSIEKDEVIIENVKVLKQRNGTGKLLVNKVKDISRDLGLKCTLYSYPQDNTISQENLNMFYLSLGFELDPDDVDGKLMTY